MSCGVGRRCGSDPALLWLWLCHRPAAIAVIRPLGWESPYAMGKKTKKKKERKADTIQLTHRNNALFTSLVSLKLLSGKLCWQTEYEIKDLSYSSSPRNLLPAWGQRTTLQEKFSSQRKRRKNKEPSLKYVICKL